jgi:hypothetical protein
MLFSRSCFTTECICPSIAAVFAISEVAYTDVGRFAPGSSESQHVPRIVTLLFRGPKWKVDPTARSTFGSATPSSILTLSSVYDGFRKMRLAAVLSRNQTGQCTEFTECVKYSYLLLFRIELQTRYFVILVYAHQHVCSGYLVMKLIAASDLYFHIGTLHWILDSVVVLY